MKKLEAKPWCFFGFIIFESGLSTFEFVGFFCFFVCLFVCGAIKTVNAVEQRSANYGPRASSGPPPVFVWPTVGLVLGF